MSASNDVPLIPSARRSGGGGDVPWARQAGASEERVTDRKRRMVEGLPSWEPLPPGEILIRRPSSS